MNTVVHLIIFSVGAASGVLPVPTPTRFKGCGDFIPSTPIAFNQTTSKCVVHQQIRLTSFAVVMPTPGLAISHWLLRRRDHANTTKCALTINVQAA